MSFMPRQYADMAIYLASDIDLGDASEGELAALVVEAIAAGWGYELSYA
jgi:hypothetical protein